MQEMKQICFNMQEFKGRFDPTFARWSKILGNLKRRFESFGNFNLNKKTPSKFRGFYAAHIYARTYMTCRAQSIHAIQIIQSTAFVIRRD